MHKIFVDRIGDDLASQMHDALAFIDWENTVRPDSTVLIKPNLTWPEPKPGVTTSPAFLDALLSVLTSRATKIYVGESDGGTFPAEEAFVRNGLADVCKRYGVPFVNLTKKPARMIEDRVAGRRIQIEASSFLMDDVDVFITAPVLKTHVITRVTLGLKNQWGCIPDPMRLLYHHILDWGIVALNRAYAPQISVLDGTYAMDRRGPLEGDAIPAGWMAVSDNVVALDALGCHLLGVDPRSVRHVAFAEQEKLGTTDFNQMQLNRPLPEPVIQSVIEPDSMDRIAIFLYKRKLMSKLVFDSAATPLLYRLIQRTPPGNIQSYQPADGVL
ncbi:MAG: DUF362 domain-containing protein [Chloroflexota bacterium]|nr:DUF362 domain-containing protein [Chloroflexota bacterium]